MWEYLAMMIGFAGVIKGADFLVDAASQLAKRLHVSDLVIGLTIVSFGTSVPELSVNIFATMTGSTEIAVSNVLGSNIANILLILGISSVIFPLSITKGTVWYQRIVKPTFRFQIRLVRNANLPILTSTETSQPQLLYGFFHKVLEKMAVTILI